MSFGTHLVCIFYGVNIFVTHVLYSGNGLNLVGSKCRNAEVSCRTSLLCASRRDSPYCFYRFL